MLSIGRMTFVGGLEKRPVHRPIVAICLLLGATSLLCGGIGRMYWTQADQVRVADLDGTNASQLIAGASSQTIEFDSTGNKLYWYDDWSLQRADPDGGGIETLFNPLAGVAATGEIRLAIDGIQAKVYYAYGIEEAAGKIGRADFDGSNQEIIVQAASAADVELDVAGGKIYYVSSHRSAGMYPLMRADLDGANAEVLLELDGFPLALAVDPRGPTLYWAESSGLTDIRRATFDPTSPETLLRGLDDVFNLEIDVDHAKIYYTQGPDIRRANLDGSSVETLGNGTAALALALDPRHASAGEIPPSLSVGKSGTDVQLVWSGSCENGDDDFAVYEGTLGGVFDDHLPMTCSTAGATELVFTPRLTSSYYLVVPQSGGLVEGSYGAASDGARPASPVPCLDQSFRPCPACERDADCSPPEVCQEGVCLAAACSPVVGCNCCSGGDGLGCDCPECEELVCAADPFCCATGWDPLCDSEATSLCTCC